VQKSANKKMSLGVIINSDNQSSNGSQKGVDEQGTRLGV
jgi:hypothetical protein